MKYFSILLLLLMSACSRETGDGGARAAAAVAAIALQSQQRSSSPAPSAPIELDYQMPVNAPAGQPLTIELTLNTPVDSGVLVATVSKQVGVTLLSQTVQQIDLAGAVRPLKLPLSVLPSAAAKRSLVIVVAVEVGGEQQSRSFRITLPASSDASY
jgi:hypothetical protein